MSTQVIKSAFKLLTEKRLLASRSRTGVFVNTDGVLPGMKKLILLNETQGPYDLNYLGRVFGLSEGLMIQQGFHVQMRSIPNGPLLPAAFRYELHQIDMEHPDGLVINASTVPAEEIMQIRKRDYPVLFLGDFVHGDIPGLPYDLIRERTEERGAAYIETVREIGCRKICVLGSRPGIDYLRRLLEGIRTRAEKYGIEVLVSDDYPHEHEDREIVQSWKRLIREILEEFRPEALIADGFGHLEPLLTALRELGFSPGRDIQILGDSDCIPGIIMIRSDYSEFVRSAAAVIRRMIEEPGYHCGILEIAGKIRRIPFRLEAV